MNSRERVQRAVTFGTPDRIPLAMGHDADIANVGYSPPRDFRPRREGINEWGIVWRSLNAAQGDQGQVAEHPLADWNAIGEYRFPDPYAPGRFAGVAERIKRLHDDGKFVRAGLGKGPMHLLDDLRGFESYLMDLMTEPDRIEWLLDGIFSFLTGLVEQFGALGVDGVIMTDDQAIQSGPLFSMDIWRERFKPRYTELCNLAHGLGCKVFMHACGNLSEHLVDLCETGVDAIDNKQPALWMNCPAMDRVRGKLAFSSCLDIQSVMQTIPLDRVEEETNRLIRRLSVPEGGFLANWYEKPDLRLCPEKLERMKQAFAAFDW